jgi:hypothetical protein
MRGAASTALTGASIALLALGAGCEGASSDPGLGALMRASGAQYAPGELLSAMDAEGPTVTLVSTNSTIVTPGLSRNILGSAMGSATGIQVGLEGDNAHWILPTGSLDTDQPGNITFQTTLSFASDLPSGMRKLIFRAVDATGNVGASRDLGIRIQPQIPKGTLVVSLDWDTEADLDLHVTVPNATEPDVPVIVWAKEPLALPTSKADGTTIPHTAAELAGAGFLDFDSNSMCVIDGRRQENLIFPEGTPAAPAIPPPSGTYEVRVDAASLCGQGVARWHAVAVANDDVDNPIAEAVGQLSDLDASRPHVPSSGILAFTFTFP